MVNGNRLLVVDDDDAIRALLCEAAVDAGYAAAGAASRAEFLAALRAFDPTVVILDLTIPGTDGVELLRDIAETTQRPSVILVSGQDARVLAGVERLARMRGVGVAGVLAKPFRMPDLWALLHAARGTSAAELAAALANGEFELFYQPKVGLAGEGRPVVGAEALLRWRHPTRGIVGPAEFVPLAEASGVIAPLTEFVVRGVARQARLWRTRRTAVPIAVNFSPTLMCDLAWPERIGAILDAEGVPTAAIVVEITESGAMADPGKALEIATRLRLRDIALSLDDFGAGYASVVELYRLPLQELKLDRSLIADVEHDGAARTVVSALIALARELGLAICAEGVENVCADAFLRRAGCHTAQGFLYSRPVAAAAHEAMVAAGSLAADAAAALACASPRG